MSTDGQIPAAQVTGLVKTIVAGANVSVDSTDPEHPIVTSTASGGGGASATSFPGLISGTTYQGTWNSSSTTTGTLTVGNLLLHPLLVPNACTIDQLIANVTVAGAAGVLRLGIYASDANGLASGLLLDAGTVTGAATGNRVKTVSLALTPGLYWIASLQEAVGGTWTAYASGMGANVLGAGNMRLAKSGVTVGALPATASGAVPDSAAGGLRTLVHVA